MQTYGLLASHGEAELRDFIYQLIGQGALMQESLILSSGRAAPILKFTAMSVEVMKGKRAVRLVLMVHKSAAAARKRRGEVISWVGVDHELFDARRRTAEANWRRMLPYVIFSDATLRELARVRPTTLQNFRMIYGVGERKLKELGGQFVDFIAKNRAENPWRRMLRVNAPGDAGNSGGIQPNR